MNSPRSLVTVVEATPVPSCVATTVTPGSTAPLSSVTRPTMTPVSICAKAVVAKGRRQAENEQANAGRRHRNMSQLPERVAIVPEVYVDPLLPDRIDAQLPGPDRREIQEDEAVEHRELAAVLNRPEARAARAPGSRPRHLAAGDERDRAGEQPDRDHEAADELDDAGQPALRGQLHRRAAKQTKQLLRAVLRKRQARDDPEQRVKVGGEAGRAHFCIQHLLHTPGPAQT